MILNFSNIKSTKQYENVNYPGRLQYNHGRWKPQKLIDNITRKYV